MKTFWKKISFHKMDEMERHYTYRSQRNAYLFLMLSLAVWSISEGRRGMLEAGRTNPLPAVLLGTASLIQLFSKLILIRNAVKEDEDSYETKPFQRLAIFIFSLFAFLLVAGLTVLYMGMRP